MKHPRGSEVNTAKLDEHKVYAIRQLHREGFHTQKQLADTFGVSPKQVSRIIRGENWPIKEKTAIRPSSPSD